MKILNLIKLIASEFLNKINFKIYSNENNEIVKALKDKGYHVYDNFVSKEICNQLITETDSLLHKNEFISVESNGSDLRIYGVDKLSDKFNIDSMDKLNSKVHNLTHFFSKRLFFLLLGKINFQEGNKGSGTGWHRDSPFRHQFKTILYLSDVSEENGPFQFIEGSHKAKSVLRTSFKLKKSLSEDRFSNQEAILSINKNEELITFTAKAGTLILVDTRGLHRGKPLLDKNRYALTTYNYNRKLPKTIINLPLFRSSK